MTHSFTRRAGALAMIGFAAATVVACSPPSDDDATPAASGSSGAADAKTATSAEAFGGMAALEAAAKKEGALNVIALPPELGQLRRGHQGLPGQVPRDQDHQRPARRQQRRRDLRRPSGSRASPGPRTCSTSAPPSPWPTPRCSRRTRWPTWKDIGDDFKEPTGLWVNDYGGYMGIGYDSAKVPAPTSVADLLKADYKGKVALNGNPTEAGAAFAGVQMASVANGGTVGDLTKGVDFFSQLNKAGNFLPVDPTPATIESGPDPGRHRLGLPQRRRDGQAADLEGDGAQGGRHRRLLLPGGQRRRPAPGRRAAVAGVPLLRRRPEPLAQGWRPADPLRGHEGRGHARHRGSRRAAAGRRAPRSCRPRPTPSPARPTSPANWANAVG